MKTEKKKYFVLKGYHGLQSFDYDVVLQTTDFTPENDGYIRLTGNYYFDQNNDMFLEVEICKKKTKFKSYIFYEKREEYYITKKYYFNEYLFNYREKTYYTCGENNET